MVTRHRVYIPMNAERFAALQGEGALGEGLQAFAVTQSVRRSDPSGDEEEWEYEVMLDAALACRAAGWPLAVAAGDVERTRIDDTAEHGSTIRLVGPVKLRDLVAFHVGDDVVSGSTVDDASNPELSWYDVTELDEVSRLVGQARS